MSSKVIDNINYLWNLFSIHHKHTGVPLGVSGNHSRDSVPNVRGWNGKDSDCHQISPAMSENGYAIMQVAQI
jgi:hypothetical protein